MVDQDHDLDQICSNGSNRSSSKRLKQKKVPQRGLGVAQLEKIRIEEQHKKDPNFSSPSPISPTDSSAVPTVPFSDHTCTNNDNTSKSCVPQSPPSPPSPVPPVPLDLPSPNRVFRTRSMPNTEKFCVELVAPLNPNKGGGFSVGWPTLPVRGNVSLPKLWRPNPHEFSPNQNGENSGFASKMSLPYETCSIVPLPDVVPRTQQYHHVQPPSSLVNKGSLMCTSSSSSVLDFPVEPPSNQSYYGNYSPLWPDEKKMMLGMKRACPFPLDDPPMPTFHSKFAPFDTRAFSNTDEQIVYGNGGTTYNVDSDIPIFRNLPPYPSVMPEPASSRSNGRAENGNSNGELLSLAPPTRPTFTLPFSIPSTRFKQSIFLASHDRELCNFDTLPYQGSVDGSVVDSRHSGLKQHPDVFSFFPSTNTRSTSASPPALANSCNIEVGENIDLNLTL